MNWFWELIIALIAGKKKKEKEEPKEEPKPSFDLGSVQWLGANYSSAEEAAKLSSASMDDHFLFLGNSVPANWLKTKVKVTVQGIVCIFYEKDGQIVGGKFDWLRPSQTHKELKNLRTGYKGHTMPEPGARCWTMFVDINGRLRSNAVEVKRS